ncbi:hypothetical protein [Devosia ginsengisoli]|nr:hypothetical protein [Devosia ginsengisoli]
MITLMLAAGFILALCLAAASLIASTLRSDDTRQAPTSNRR